MKNTKNVKSFNEHQENLNISDVSESVNNKFIYIVIDQDMHSYEAILGVYDSFEKAMNCNEWSNRGITPNERGEGDSLFIYKEELNKELVPKF